MLLQAEIKKIVKRKIFAIASCVLLLLLLWMGYVQYAEGIVYEDHLGNRTSYHGAAFIRHDRQTSEPFNGRVIDDAFLLDVQAASVAFTWDGTVERIEGTALHRFYKNIQSGNSERIGVLNTHAAELFGDTLPVYYHTENWYRIISAIVNMNTLFLFFTVLVCAQVYSAEYSSNMFLQTAPTQNGRAPLARTKIAAAVCVVSLAFLLTVLLTILLFGGIYGFSHASADIRVFANGAFLGMPPGVSCLVLLGVTILFCYLAVLCTCAVTLLCSALCSNAYTALTAAPFLVFFADIFQLRRFAGTVGSALYRHWPSQLSALTLSDWYRAEEGLPMAAWIFIYLAVTVVFLYIAQHCYAHHRLT